MKTKQIMIWLLVAALGLTTVIVSVLLMKSFQANRENQRMIAEKDGRLADLSDELLRAKDLASATEESMNTQAAGFQQQAEAAQQTLLNALEERDALQTQVEALNTAAEQAAEDAQAMQAKYDAALASLREQKQQVESLTKEITALKAAQTEAEKNSSDAQNTLNAKIAALEEALSLEKTTAIAGAEQLTKAKADLDAANKAKEAQDKAVAALNEQLTKAQAAAKDAEQVAVLNEQLKKAQADLDAAKKEKEAQGKTVAALNEQLTKAQADLDAAKKEKEAQDKAVAALNEQLAAAKAAAKDAEQVAALNEQLKKAQADLDAANKAKETQDKAVAALNEQLTKAKADLDAANKTKETQDKAVAALNEQLTAAKAAAKDAEQVAVLNEQLKKAQADLDAANKAKEAQDKAVAALNEQLAKAQADLDAAKKDKEAQEKTAAALNEQLTAAQDADVKGAEQVAALNQQLAKAQADLDAAKKDKETQDKAVAALNEQLAKAQADLDSAKKDKETQDKAVAALNEQLKKAQADLDAAKKEKETQDKAVAALNEQLTAAKAAAAKDAEEAAALNVQLAKAQADLDAAKKDKEAQDKAAAALNEQLAAAKAAAVKDAEEAAALNEQLAKAQADLDAVKKEKEAQDKAAAALNEQLTAETERLRAGLEAETLKSAQLQEELNVQAAHPEALAKRLEEVSAMEDAQEEQLLSLSGAILTAFKDSIPADAEGGVRHPVYISVVKDGQVLMTGIYSLTKAQEAQAYQAAQETNESQSLYQIDLNHEAAALLVNGTVIDKQAFRAAYEEVFSHNPGADEETLKKLAVQEAVKAEVLRQHEEAIGLDPDARNAESKLWETALKNVTVSAEDLSSALAERQAQEDEILASDPAKYARMLEEGEIASAQLPEGSRFVKQLTVPVDFSARANLLPQLEAAQKKLSVVNEIVYGERRYYGYSKDELNEYSKERDKLAKQVYQLNNQQKQLKKAEEEAEAKAAELARQILNNPEAFGDIAAQAQPDEAMPATGYAVFKGAVNPGKAFVTAALALQKQGDVSRPIKMDDGYHVFFYSEEITENSATIQKAQDAVEKELLAQLLETMKADLLLQWVSEANVVSNIE